MKIASVFVLLPAFALAQKKWSYSEDPNAKAAVVIGVGATSLNGADMAASAMGDNNKGIA